MNYDKAPTPDEIRNGGLALATKLCLEKKYSEAKKLKRFLEIFHKNF